MCELCEIKKEKYKERIQPTIDKLRSFIDIKKYEPVIIGKSIPIKIWEEDSKEPSLFVKTFYNQDISNEIFINNIKFFSFKIPKINNVYGDSIVYEYIKAEPIMFVLPEHSEFCFQKIIEIINELNNIENISSLNEKPNNVSKSDILNNLENNDYIPKKQKHEIQEFILSFNTKNLKNNQFIHGDLWMENILYDTVSKETFLVDFELLTLFDRNYDYSLMCLSITQRMPEYIPKYIQALKTFKDYNKDTFLYLFFAKSFSLYEKYRHYDESDKAGNANKKKLRTDILLFINKYKELL